MALAGVLGCSVLAGCGKDEKKEDTPTPAATQAAEKKEEPKEEEKKEEPKKEEEEDVEEPEEDVVEDEGMGDVSGYFYVGEWAAGDYMMEIIDGGDDNYVVNIAWDESEDILKEWEYFCVFDAENGVLTCDAGTLYVLEMANGEVSAKHTEYADGSAVFQFGETGITWIDSEDETHEQLVFEAL